MDEPQNAKPKTQQPQPPQDSPKAFRIPLTRIVLNEAEDLPGGNSIAHDIDFAPPKPGRQYFIGFFVPAWQVIECFYFKTDKTEPVRFLLPLARVKRIFANA
jgi:hypothetical protein